MTEAVPSTVDPSLLPSTDPEDLYIGTGRRPTVFPRFLEVVYRNPGIGLTEVADRLDKPRTSARDWRDMAEDRDLANVVRTDGLGHVRLWPPRHGPPQPRIEGQQIGLLKAEFAAAIADPSTPRKWTGEGSLVERLDSHVSTLAGYVEDLNALTDSTLVRRVWRGRPLGTDRLRNLLKTWAIKAHGARAYQLPIRGHPEDWTP